MTREASRRVSPPPLENGDVDARLCETTRGNRAAEACAHDDGGHLRARLRHLEARDGLDVVRERTFQREADGACRWLAPFTQASGRKK